MKKWMILLWALALCSCQTTYLSHITPTHGCSINQEGNHLHYSNHNPHPVWLDKEIWLPVWLDINLPDSIVGLGDNGAVVRYPSNQYVFITLSPLTNETSSNKETPVERNLSAEEAFDAAPSGFSFNWGKGHHARKHATKKHVDAKLAKDPKKPKAKRCNSLYSSDYLTVLLYNIKPENIQRFKEIIYPSIHVDRRPPVWLEGYDKKILPSVYVKEMEQGKLQLVE